MMENTAQGHLTEPRADAQRFTADERTIFAKFADQLIPSNGSMPLPSSLEVEGAGLDRLFPLRPELAGPIRGAIAWARAQNTSDANVFALEKEHPDLFAAVAAGAAGIYLTENEVKQRLGYPGRPALDVGDLDAQSMELVEMTADVRERGFMWKQTPTESLSS
jgi:hypothetical protein